jgi:hypothetical protein
MEAKRTVLADIVAESYREQKLFLQAMSDQARDNTGTAKDWSPKDTVAHVVHWNSMVAADSARGDTPPPEQDEDYNQLNARIWQRYSEFSWGQIEDLMEQTQQEMMENLEQLTEEDVSDPERFRWLDRRALWRNVAFTYYYHSLQHIAELYARQGDLAYANQIQEKVLEQQSRFSDSEDWLGTAHYNLGCHYAITGQVEKALEQINKGVTLYPVLKKWAPDDPDLKSLHELPEFISLMESE